MRDLHLKHIFIATGGLLGVCIVGLWSWNTLATLFDAPTAEFRHALAFLALLTIVRFVVLPRQHRRTRSIFTKRGQVI